MRVFQPQCIIERFTCTGIRENQLLSEESTPYMKLTSVLYGLAGGHISGALCHTCRCTCVCNHDHLGHFFQTVLFFSGE